MGNNNQQEQEQQGTAHNNKGLFDRLRNKVTATSFNSECCTILPLDTRKRSAISKLTGLLSGWSVLLYLVNIATLSPSAIIS